MEKLFTTKLNVSSFYTFPQATIAIKNSRSFSTFMAMVAMQMSK